MSYKYTNNISRSVFNYNQALRNINFDDYRNASSSCDCQSSTFRYEPHGHVITGDLRIVRNRKLRRLLEKGPKYREQNNIDWHLNKDGGTQRQFSENICWEDDLRSRIFGTFVVKFFGCLPLLGFSNI